MDYHDLDLHLSLIINEAWAEGNTRPFSQYMPETARVAGQLIGALKKAERASTATPMDTHTQTDVETLKAFLQASMRREAHERASKRSNGRHQGHR